MKLRALNNRVSVKDKVVLLRIDSDVPIVRGLVNEGPDGRIARASVGIEWLRQRGAKVVVIGHRGRPNGKRIAALSMSPVAKRIGQLLGTTIPVSKYITGPNVDRQIQNMQSGDILILENIRFLPGERKDDIELAKKLAQLADMYVNDAFAVSHRCHASVHAIANQLPSYAGLELQREVNVLGKLLRRPGSPFVVVLGGKKIHTKIETLEAFLKNGAHVCIGGALAHPFYIAQGCEIGLSFVEKTDVPLAERLLERYGDQIILPEDVVTVKVIRRKAPTTIVNRKNVGKKDYLVDIGPETIRRFSTEIASARTIVWNGPLGITETPDFAKGTHAIVKRIAARKGSATTIVGGGDTVPVVDSLKLNQSFTLVSTGGGAMMTFLAGQELPGLEALKI